MKRVINFLIVGLMLMSVPLLAQNPTAGRTQNDRMQRDIAVMETALSEMIKQEFDQRNFFFMDVKGNYLSGYGVTFTVPTGMLNVWGSGNSQYMVIDGNGFSSTSSWSSDDDLAVTEEEAMHAEEAMKSLNKAQRESDKAERARQRADNEALEPKVAVGGVYPNGSRSNIGVAAARGKRFNSDSLNAINNARIIKAAKTFIADYGDMLSQLGPEERIVVTNRSQGNNEFWIYGQKAKRSLLSVEAKKSDLTAFRQGKISRDQLMSKIKVVNSVSTDKAEPDMELLVSIFNRLYQSDLSKTYYVQGNTYYEHLNDFGAIVHMQVYSSNTNYLPDRGDETRTVLSMPTLGLNNLSQEERDKKVKELYPVFENELKENIIDYGRTLKSLNDNEQLIVDVTLTKCKGCGIPAKLEVAVKASVLKDFNAGKIDRNSALSKIEVTKAANQ